ncbi:ATP-binding cassette domain-containing protein [Lactobacillus sp. ESL0791]|uniref:ATP-binding cassette domain-containing protein n=1 Tax=Lactobacillus sp. ESL0791 TaxID=2983234 RepID=UPI0023F79D6F|nr:ATP-binding cassette domain-containing protein [Lactobacillus sp. ESL0791]MDF7639400.1 ATP-binding cassette domain-containing protein [Lactobacillus sp. ESL0791]
MQLKVVNLSLSLNSNLILNNLNFTIKSGGLIGLIGPNGAGKSTLLKVIATIIKPGSGKIMLDGVNIVKEPKKMRQLIGYMPQKVPFYSHLTAMEYLQYIAALKNLPQKESVTQIDSLLTKFQLSNVGRKKLANFSGGMIQRVGLIAALLGDPKIIVVDEPTAGLDPIERVILRNTLAELAVKRIVLLSTHIISDIEAIANDLIILQSGTIKYQGTASGLIAKAQNLVWEYVLPSGTNISNLTNVSSLIQGSDGLHVRVIQKNTPNSAAKLVVPSLEDASLALIESCDQSA